MNFPLVLLPSIYTYILKNILSGFVNQQQNSSWIYQFSNMRVYFIHQIFSCVSQVDCFRSLPKLKFLANTSFWKMTTYWASQICLTSGWSWTWSRHYHWSMGDSKKGLGMPDLFYCLIWLHFKFYLHQTGKFFKLLSFFFPGYYACSVVGVLGRCVSSVRAAVLTNLKVVIYEAIYWEITKI